MLYHDEI